ncbi:MAG: tetratricopeptide repeat protein, partial [Candidatus Acidiferrales bacterium]
MNRRLRVIPAMLCGLLVSIFAYPRTACAQTDNVTRTKIRVPADSSSGSASGLLAAAQAAMNQKDYQSAADNYEKYLEQDPGNAAAHFQLGYAYTALKRPDDARTQYEKAIELNPQMPEAYLNLGLTLMESDPAAAVAPLEKAVELQPEEARPKFLLGYAFERTGKLPEAILQYQAAEKIDGKDFDTHLALGRTLLASHRAAEAELEFRTAAALDAGNSAPRLGIAESLIEQGKLDAASAELTAYLQEHPGDTSTRVEHATVLSRLGKTDEALGELDRAAAKGAETFQALKLRAQILFDAKRYNDAIPVLQKAEALAPRDTDIPAQLGHLY